MVLIKRKTLQLLFKTLSDNLFKTIIPNMEAYIYVCDTSLKILFS